MRDLLFTVHQYGGDDATCKPRQLVIKNCELHCVVSGVSDAKQTNKKEKKKKENVAVNVSLSPRKNLEFVHLIALVSTERQIMHLSGNCT